MLDFRHETFLALCKIGSYTKTAAALHITQPAVSQHIKFLEKYYQCKLFGYKGKTLILTEQGRLLRDFALTMGADIEKLRTMLSFQDTREYPVTFGATLSIGEYVMPGVLAEMLRVYPHLHVTMSVDNTEVLLQKLRDGKIAFALLEGFFDKTEYGGAVFSYEPFIPVCSKNAALLGRTLQLAELLSSRIILREKGSGTRDVFEHLLSLHSLKVESFEKVCEIGNMNTIKQLVQDDLGITFLYKTTVEKELESGALAELRIEGFPAQHEFCFVFLKNSQHEKEYMRWYQFFKKTRAKI